MPVRQLRKSWWIDLRHEYRRYRFRSPENTRAGAQAYEATVRAALARGERSVLDPRTAAPDVVQNPTFSEFAQRWFDTYVVANNKRTERDTKRYILRRHVVPALGRLEINRLSGADIELYKATKTAEGLAAKTVNNHLAIIQRCLRSAVEWGVIQNAPPLKALRVAPSSVRALEPTELASLLGVDKEPFWSSMVRFAARTGLRRGELRGLRWTDIDLERRHLVVRRSRVDSHETTPKSNRERVIPLGIDAIAALQEHAGVPTRYVFTLDGSVPVSEGAMERALTRLAARAGVRHIGWHVLRHTFATDLVRKGATLPAVKELLGHSSIEMTMRYAHVAPSTLIATIRLLDADDGQPVGNNVACSPN